MAKLSIKLHPSLKIKELPQDYEGDFENITILLAMKELLVEYPKIHSTCMLDDKTKPGILYIADGAELGSLGILEQIIDEDLLIKIVPILHGG